MCLLCEMQGRLFFSLKLVPDTMNRKLILLSALFLLLGAGAWYALQQRDSRKNTFAAADMEFAVPDADAIHKIFMADRRGQRIVLERRGDRWIVNGAQPVRPTAIRNLLEVLQNVKVWFVPSKGLEPTMVSSLGSDGIKVELFNKGGRLLKAYYVGGVTNDERGTYMIMEGSNQPYVAHIPYFYGQIRVRFMMNEADWWDRAVFAEKPEQIQSIQVEYPQMKSASFKLEKAGEAAYTVEPYFSTTPRNKSPQRKGYAEAYLLQYESLVAEAFENNNPLRDSVTSLVPFAIVTLQTTDGRQTKARFWPLEVLRERYTGEPIVERYFTQMDTPNNFMLTQQRVFGPIFREYNAFFERQQR